MLLVALLVVLVSANKLAAALSTAPTGQHLYPNLYLPLPPLHYPGFPRTDEAANLDMAISGQAHIQLDGRRFWAVLLCFAHT